MTAIISLLVLAAGPVLVSRLPVTQDAHAFQSPARAYHATVEYEARYTDFVPFSRFDLRDDSGRAVYSRAGDGLTVLDISDNGVVVGAEFDGPVSGSARLHFFDSDGDEVGDADIGFYGQRGFSADGSVFCVNDGRAGVRVFAADGRELHGLGPAGRFAVSADGGLVALARGDTLVLFRDGAETGRVSLEGPFVREMRFSEDGELVGYVERHGVRVMRTADLEETVRWRPGDGDPEPVSLDISAGDGLVLVGLGKDHGRCAVVLLDAGGTVSSEGREPALWRSETTHERWNAFTPSVRFEAGGRFSVRTVEETETYRYREEE